MFIVIWIGRKFHTDYENKTTTKICFEQLKLIQEAYIRNTYFMWKGINEFNWTGKHCSIEPHGNVLSKIMHLFGYFWLCFCVCEFIFWKCFTLFIHVSISNSDKSVEQKKLYYIYSKFKRKNLAKKNQSNWNAWIMWTSMTFFFSFVCIVDRNNLWIVLFGMIFFTIVNWA